LKELIVVRAISTHAVICQDLSSKAIGPIAAIYPISGLFPTTVTRVTCLTTSAPSIYSAMSVMCTHFAVLKTRENKHPKPANSKIKNLMRKNLESPQSNGFVNCKNMLCRILIFTATMCF